MCFLLVVELNAEHALKVAELQQALQHKLRERQKVYGEAFNHDMEQYRATGILQHSRESLSCEADEALTQMQPEKRMYTHTPNVVLQQKTSKVCVTCLCVCV